MFVGRFLSCELRLHDLKVSVERPHVATFNADQRFGGSAAVWSQPADSER